MRDGGVRQFVDHHRKKGDEIPFDPSEKGICKQRNQKKRMDTNLQKIKATTVAKGLGESIAWKIADALR